MATRTPEARPDGGGARGLARAFGWITAPPVPELSPAARWATAPLASAACIGLHLLLPSPEAAPFMMVRLAVLVTAWLGGRGPGLLSVALTALAGNVLFVSPLSALSTSAPALSITVLYAGTGALIALLVSAFRDTVLSLRAEVAARQRNEAELVEQEQRLRAINAELEAVDRRKNEFIALLSHELRNPLAPIQNSLEILERAPANEERRRRAVDIMRRQVKHLSRLLSDLLDLSRVSSGKIHLERGRVDLTEVVRAVVEDHTSVFSARDIALASALPSEPLWVDGDRARLAQVLGNLLHNAAKFTDPKGEVHVQLRRDGATARLTVRDSGVGIAPEVLGRLFTPFTQADQTIARSNGGLGLGLALVKTLVELHGGTVRASSPGPGLGAELEVSLPLLADGGATP